MDTVDLVHQVFCFREHHKVIVGQAEDKIIVIMLGQQAGHAFQDLIPDSHTILDIKVFKMGDVIEDQGLFGTFRIFIRRMQHYLTAFHEAAHTRQAGELVDVDGLLLGVDVYNENIKQLTLLRIPVQASKLHNGLDFSGPGDDAVIQMVQVVHVGFQLFPDGSFRGFHVIRMDQPLEGPACQIEKLF